MSDKGTFRVINIDHIIKTPKGYTFGGTAGENDEFVAFVDNKIINTLYEDFKLRGTPTPLLTQEQYKERMAAEGILPEDL